MRPRGLCAFPPRLVHGVSWGGGGGGKAQPRSVWGFAGKKRLRSGAECGSAGSSGRSPPRLGDNEGAPLVIPTPPPRPPTYTRCPSRGPAPLGLLGGAQSPQPLGPPPGVGRRRADPGAARIASPVPEGARRCPRGAARGCPRISFLLYLARPHCARPPTRAVAIVTPQFELPNFSRASCLTPPPRPTPNPDPRPRSLVGGELPFCLSLPLWDRDSRSVTLLSPGLSAWGCWSTGPRGSPSPGGVLGGCVASRGVARLSPQQRSPPQCIAACRCVFANSRRRCFALY